MKKTLLLIGFVVHVVVALTVHAKPPQKVHSYRNGEWVMKEGEVPVVDPDGKPAIEHKGWSQRVGPVRLKIIWTCNNDYGWNYTTNPSPREDELPGPSVRVFMEKQLDAKSVLWTWVPDTPFRIATINGKFAPFLMDTDKDVLWRLEGLESVLGASDAIFVKDRKAVFVQEGGDWSAHLTIDLSEAAKGVQVRYREQFAGP